MVWLVVMKPCRPLVIASKISVCALAILVLAGGACSAPTVDEPVVGAENTSGPVEQITGLANVETTLHALGSVWAVTSNHSDRFSQDPLMAAVVQIDPSTREVRKVLDSPDVEPTLSVLDDEVWVRLADRVVALDSRGNEVASLDIAFGDSGDQLAAGGHLWLIDFSEATVTIVDPVTQRVVRTITTGRSPAVPIAAFGHVWIPSVTDGIVTSIDINTLGETTVGESFVSSTRLEDVTAVRNGVTGNEVWVTDVNGDVFAITASAELFGAVRQVPIEPAINRIHPVEGRAFLLPISGRDVLVLDLETEELIARIPTASIPFRAMVRDETVWVSGDGMSETLLAIDANTLSILSEFAIGSNASNTNGPHRPISVGEEIWIPNRGDGTVFIVDATGR